MRIQKLLLYFLLSACVLTLIGCQNSPAQSQGLDDEDTLLAALDVESRVETYDDYTLAVHFPVTSSPRVNVAVKAAVEERIAAFVQTIDEKEPDLAGQGPYNMTIDFEIDHLAPDVLAFSLWEVTDLGDSNLKHEITTFNIHFGREKVLSLDELFVDDGNYLARLAALAYEALAAAETLAPHRDLQWIAQGTAAVAENFRHFLLTEEGLKIYFNKYQVAPAEAGNPSVVLPYESLADLLATDALPPSLLANLAWEENPPGAAAEARPEDDGEGEAENPAGRGSTDEGDEELDQGAPAAGPGAGEPHPADTDGGGHYAGPPHPAPKRIALTFDDGPHGTVTPFILDELLARDVKATFFVLGNRVAFYPDIMERMVAEGHEIGNHSWNHAKLTRLDEGEISAQIENTQTSILQLVGVEPTLMRPPYGAIDERVQAVSPLPLVLWSVDTRDWESRNREQVVRAALTNAHDGAIILFHDLYPTTAAAVGEIVDELQAQGYELVTVSRLLGFDGQDNWAEYAGQIIRHLQ